VLCSCAQGYVAKYQRVPKPTAPRRTTCRDPVRAVAGVADLRIQAAYNALLASKAPITPAKLATRARSQPILPPTATLALWP
jgi:hypothetical protein